MSEEEWDALQPGMIVVERRSGTPRLVLNVHRRPWRAKTRVATLREHVSINLFKLRGFRSCPTTWLMPGDWRYRLDVAHGKTGIVKPEFFYCELHGWNHVTGGPVWMSGWPWPPAPDWSTMPWVQAGETS